jgi:hypothetical protein
MSRPRTALPFVGVGIAFITLGLTSNRAFLLVGFTFLIIGLASLARR